MKTWMKRSITLVLALMMLCLVGCGGGGGKTGDIDPTAGFSVTFVANLEDKVEEAIEGAKARWQSMTDVPLTFDVLSGAEALSLRMASGDFPDVVLGNAMNTRTISKNAANGILIPLDEYINETDTPNLWKMYQDYPEVMAGATMPDGHIYSLPSYSYTPGMGLEQMLFINQKWLDKLGLEMPTTVDELTEVLRAFKEGDPNGNGKKDEIGLSFHNESSESYPEVALSFWGYSTKSGTLDGYTTVRDGKVKFAPIMDEWKEMITWYRDLYAEGLLDMECYTQNADTWGAKIDADTTILGCYWMSGNRAANPEEFVMIPPFKAKEGVEPVWRMHPASLVGTQGIACITTACKNPVAAMKFLDKFYEFDNSVWSSFGEDGYAVTRQEDGSYVYNDVPADMEMSWARYYGKCNLTPTVPKLISKENFETKLPLTDASKERIPAAEMYEPFGDKEPWTRPWYSTEESNRVAELATDIFALVNEKKAKWTVGANDIDSEWETYKQDLEKLGLKELMEINQTAYDRFAKALKDAKKK